jgi:hypothetical protein
MKTKIPVIFSRINKQALWGYVMTESQIKRNFGKSIEQCMVDAAIETSIVGVVTGGLGFLAAAAIFTAVCQACLDSKLDDAIQCLFSSLIIVTERSAWEEKVF